MGYHRRKTTANSAADRTMNEQSLTARQLVAYGRVAESPK